MCRSTQERVASSRIDVRGVGGRLHSIKVYVVEEKRVVRKEVLFVPVPFDLE
jgi:hypothetical protein